MKDKESNLIIKQEELENNETILKRNNIIRLKTLDLSSILSHNSLKLYNYIYYLFQLNRNNINDFDYTIKIKQTVLKDKLKIKDKNYTKIIQDSFNELIDTKVILNNFSIENDVIVKEYKTHLITSILDGEKFSDNKTKIFRITIDKVLFNEMMRKESGYTLLELNYINPLNRSTQIRLYELCKSYQNMKKTPELNLDELNELFFTNHKYISKLYPIINNSIKVINKNTDIKVEYNYDKKKKTINFIIKENLKLNKQKTAIKIKQKFLNEKEEEELMIERLVNNEILWK
jgi:hypothetical protein